ncbi:MAG TPA: amino acid adenylation domain-containing protein, partial [Thermoanaerobaculia bacterium]|nr:amino acid adenylation domain-containing protein [Thermoanaerobaculia bacterium]
GVEVPLKELFEAPTVASLARRLEALVPQAGGVPPRPPIAATGEAEHPLSFAQERLWFLDRLEPGGSAYVIPSELDLAGRLGVAALGDAVGELVRRHEVLRTVFVAPGGRPLQRVLPGGPGALPVVDLGGLSGASRDAELERLVTLAERRPFDLAQGPVLRRRLVRLGGDDHRLLATLHHIAGDGWSTGVFVGELGSLYAAYVGGVPSPLPEPRVQYGDFARWQRAWLAGDELSTQLGYWREQLGGLEGKSLDLPADRPRPPVHSPRSGRRTGSLPPGLAASLRSLARREGATLFMVLLAAFQALLARWTGERDVWVGTPVANRPSVELEGLVGLFLNTLVLRADLSGRPGFREVVARVREAALGAYAHQDVPFERLVEELAPRRDLSRSPLFQVFFNMLNLPRRELELPGVTLEVPARPERTAKFDLSVYVEEPAGEPEVGARLTWVYDAELFDEARIAELARQYLALLEGAMAEPERWVGELPLRPAWGDLLPDPRRALPAPAAEPAGPIPAPFEAWARSVPERVAVAGGAASLTYGRLARLARGLARSLAAAGVGRGDVVAVGASREPGLVVALLGVLSAGAAFVVVDAGYPAAHRARVVRLARPRGWIGVAPEPAGDELAEALAEVPLVVSGRWEELAAAGGDGPLGVAVSGDDLAYVAFTSGTTGEPRGIRGTHAPVSRFLAWQRERFGLGEADRVSVLSGLAHDPLLRDVFAPLAAGATLCLPPARERHEPAELARFLAVEAVTVAHLTPGLGRLIASGLGERTLPALGHVFFGGDVLRPEQAAAWRRLAPGAQVVNLYGTTETPQAVGWHRVGPEETRSAAIPLGRGVEPAELLVVAESGLPAAVGEPGEIWVRSPLLAAGYLGDGESSGGFLANPFAEDAAEVEDRVYRTGDLGRYTPAGEVVFAGRIDHQVKVRGVRVEPEAVEAALGSAPGVAEAAVTARSGPDGEARLVAWVVAAEAGDVPEPAALRAHAGRLLPEPMVPSLFVALEALPRLPNGKLDRRALAAREPEWEAPGAQAVAPRTALEEIVAGIWAEVLGVEGVGVTASFFELGGHSLLAARVVSRVRETLGAEVPLKALFEAPTVAALAARVEAAQGAGGVRPPLEPAPAGATPVLSFAQERLWFLDRLEPGGTAYNIPVALVLRGRLAAAALEQGFAEVERRHAVLRTRFATEGGAPVPVVEAAWPAPAGVVDLAGLPRAVREAQAGRLAAREARRPFDLAQGPVLRRRLVRLGGDDHRLLATLHHIAGDGWSSGLFVHEVASLYTAYLGGVPSPLVEPRVQYADFARWQRAWLAGDELSTQLAYWRERLAGLGDRSLDLPVDRPRPPVHSPRSGRRTGSLPPELAASLRSLARREGATLFMVLLAAFQALLGRWSGQDDVAVGAPIAGRTREELEPLVG